MNSLFDNVYLGKPCAEQHLREIRQAIEADQLARRVQSNQSHRVIGPSQQSRLDARYVVGRFASRLVAQTHILTKLVKVMETDGDL